MKRTPTLDELVSLAERGDWQTPLWKRGYWHEVDKAKFEKTRALWNLAWASFVMILIMGLVPLGVWLTVELHPWAGVFVGLTYGGLLLRHNYRWWWEDLRDWQKVGERYRKLGLVDRRYFETTGQTLNPKGREIS